MHLFFYHIHQWVDRHKGLAIVFCLSFLLCCGYLASRLTFKEDISQVIPKSDQSDLVSKALQQVKFADKITLLLQREKNGTLDDVTRCAQELIDTLSQDTVFVQSIEGQISSSTMSEVYDFVYNHIPFFLDSTDYSHIDSKLHSDSIKAQVASNYRQLSTASGMMTASFIQKDPLGIAMLGLQKLQNLNLGNHFILYDGFVTTKDSTSVLLFLNPRFSSTDTEHNEAFVYKLKALQDSLNRQYKDKARVLSFGSAMVAVANAQQIKHDIMTTVMLSMGVLMVLLVVFYRRIVVPLLVFVPTVFAALFSLAILYIYKPVISAISISIGAVLIGITIDYALHVLTHYRQNENIKTLYKELTKPLLMSGATTSIAFLCLLFVHSEVLVDLGVFAAVCVFFSTVFTLLIIPHVYKPKTQLTYNSWLDKLAKFSFERNKLLISICLVLIVISVFSSQFVGYNNDLSTLNFVPKELKEVENKLDAITNTQAKSLYIIATGDSYEQALANNEKVSERLSKAKSQNRIIEYAGLHEILKSESQQKRDLDAWRHFWDGKRRDFVQQQLVSETAHYGFSPDAHESFYNLIRKDLNPYRLEEIQRVPGLGSQEMLGASQDFYTITTLVKCDEDKRDAVIQSFDGERGVVIIDRKQLSETYLGKLRDDFNNLVAYSFVAVLAILWVFFRRIELVLLSAIPIGLTGLVTAGLMGIFGLEFNIFSAIVCTLIFGHGVDFSIFMTTALQKQYSTGKDELQTYRTSILLAVLTTVLAIGALIFAKHPALLSISTVSLIGVFSAVLITFVFYPILFRFFISDRAKKGLSPYTFLTFILSILLFLYYGLGCVVVSFYGRVLLRMIPMKQASRDRLFRKAMSKFMKTVLYYHPFVGNNTINPNAEKFDRPSVIIANHSSFLDTLSIGMTVPKVVFLVNDWVWNSPIFGKAVRYLGFYPVEKGLTDGLMDLQLKISQGYHLVVFPEGTRSRDNALKRFHKGAYYLAEQLKVDVLPIYLHGNGDCLPKGDFIIYPGTLTVVIGNRIRPEDSSYGVDYRERSKAISREYRNSFLHWRRELEDEHYFIKKLNLAYRYKDEEIVKAVRENLEQNKNVLKKLNTLLPYKGDITHLAGDYGEIDFLLSLQSGDRKIYSYISDEEKRQVAQSIYYTQFRKVCFTDVLSQNTMLLISKKLSNEDVNLIANTVFSRVINICSDNHQIEWAMLGYRLIDTNEQIECFAQNEN